MYTCINLVDLVFGKKGTEGDCGLNRESAENRAANQMNPTRKASGTPTYRTILKTATNKPTNASCTHSAGER